jgi:hypothetical protein
MVNKRQRKPVPMVTISVYLAREISERLIEKATQEKRPVSQMAAIFIEDKLNEVKT